MVRIARCLRQGQVRSEDMLWEELRNRRLAGVRFKRQQPMGRFVVDFFAPAARLVVEVDGPIHQGREDLDELRQRAIERRGLRFIRLRSQEVEQDLPAALARIEAALAPPRPAGERGQGG